MRPPVRFSIVIFLLLAVAAAGCGKSIGDSCQIASDCSPNGDRICLEPDNKSGYCTIMGCDYNTCPDQAVCVRFFMGQFDNKPCNHTTEDSLTPPTTNDCSLDELCDLEDHCVPRSAEVRYCMAKCSSNGDCRDGYECRNLQDMIEHGGEPVLAPGVPVDSHAPNFCALAPS